MSPVAKKWFVILLVTAWFVSTVFAFWWFQFRNIQSFDPKGINNQTVFFESGELGERLENLVVASPSHEESLKPISVVHFWALSFTYIWAGPHHLHYTALPDWTQSLGMVFSLILLAPSWGGMINGIMTLSGAWEKLRTDPILKFLVVAISFYGMSTFEGPMMSIKTVNALSHYTDWTIGHVHSGALGWVAMISIGSMYFMIARLFGKTQMYSIRMIELHFWISTLGVVLYIAAMWISGVMQGLMWRATNTDGTLTYSFIETVTAMHPFYVTRTIGGLVFLSGMFLMAYNVWKTVTADDAKAVDAIIPEPAH